MSMREKACTSSVSMKVSSVEIDARPAPPPLPPIRGHGVPQLEHAVDDEAAEARRDGDEEEVAHVLGLGDDRDDQ